ncbi:TauD/TfdA family dioxygenase, partial [Xenorhabdus sp. PR6a]|uniref:TauD/TfdA family dioxygenase n=1 Tax=Xenorhabdus sp. PR6a TaxID=3025877 RepID=UPI002359FCC8
MCLLLWAYSSENVLVALGVLAGEPYSIAHEGLELVNNLTPHKETTRQFTGLGSEVELDFHIENAAQAYMPEGDTSPFALLLLGIRNEPEGGPFTRISDCRRALDKLSQEDIEYLYSKHYIIRVPYRWRGVSSIQGDNTDLVPILSGPLFAPRVTVAFYPDMVLAANPRAKLALDNLYQAIREVSFGVQVCPGRLLLINNSFTLHSRDQFQPVFDENERAFRWVQRIFVARNLWNFRSFTAIQERVFSPLKVM